MEEGYKTTGPVGVAEEGMSDAIKDKLSQL